MMRSRFSRALKKGDRHRPIAENRESRQLAPEPVPVFQQPVGVRSLDQRRRLQRAGFTLFELTIAAILLAAVMVTAIPTLAWIVRVRHAAERQQVAILGVGNLMERVTALAWDEITPEALAEISLPENLARQLPAADLKISVVSTAETPEAKRVSIELRWQESSAGALSPPVRLAAWVYRHRRELT